MQNYKLLIQYEGTRYKGWQSQITTDQTVQGKFTGILSRMAGEPVDIQASGRTDAGVHAREQAAHVKLRENKDPEEIREYLNRYLPEDIAVTEVREASPRFHARYNALGKTYRYTCYDGDVKPVFDRRYCTFLEEKPDLELMRQAAEALKGTHDFRNFCVNPKMKKSTVRCVDGIDIDREDGYIRFTFHGNGFLQNMVRIMVGTLLEAGCGRMTAEQVKEVLNNPHRQKAGPTAPAQGLCLMSVDYD